MRSIFKMSSDDMPPNESEGAIHYAHYGRKTNEFFGTFEN